MQQRLNLNYALSWHGNWHVGSGFRTAATDRLIQRMGVRDGLAFVPGSQLKGVLRHTCEGLVQALGLDAVDPHATSDQQERRLVENFRPLSSSDLIVDRLFGTRFQGDCLFVDNAMPLPVQTSETQTAENSVVRTRTAMDRPTGTVREGHLFTTEMADSSIKLAGRIRARHPAGVLTQFDEGFPYEYAILIASLLSIDMLGGEKSTGLGRCNIEIDKVVWNGVAATAADCLQPLGELAECDSESLKEWIHDLRSEVRS